MANLSSPGHGNGLPPRTGVVLLVAQLVGDCGRRKRPAEGHCNGPTRERALRPRTMVAGRDGGSAVARKDDGEDALFFGLMYAHQW